MKIAFKTLGCRVNLYETDALASRFKAAGYDIADSDADARWLERLNGLLALDVHAIGRRELSHLTGYRIMPWGWCLDLRRRLVKWGADRQLLPTKDEIYHLRGLSHRRLTINIHLRLQELLRCQATSHSGGTVESIGCSPSKIEGARGSMTASTAGNHTPQSLRASSSILEEQLSCSGSKCSSPSKIEGAGGSMTHQFLAGAMRLNPCVELNLRPTMGAVTSVLGDRVVAPGCIGSFCIEQRSSASEPWRSHAAPVIENGRLRGGTLCLTTPSDTALYRALLSIGD